MRLVYGRSPWIARFPKSRVPSHPKHRGELDVEVLVIGGGLTGCATAYAFAASGMSVALFEADRIGVGSSGAGTGWITEEPPTSFLGTEKVLGRRAARLAWQAWRRAALDLETLIGRLGLTCAAQSRSALTIARSTEQAARLTREHKARSAAGLGTVLVPARGLDAIAGFPATAAIRSRDNATVDPYRLTLGLAAAARKRGVQIFDRSPVTKAVVARDAATVSIGAASVRAAVVIVATGSNTSLFPSLARHFTPRTSYLTLTEPIPAKVRKTLGTRNHLLRDLADPAHRFSWVDDERLLVSGADTPPVPLRSRDAALVQRTGQLMYELSTFYPDISGVQPAFGWDVPYLATATGLPVVGPHRNYPHYLFAFGAGSQSPTGAYLASRILLRHYTGEPQPADQAFGFAH